MRAARLTVRFADGGEASEETTLALGNPGNPMSWDDLRAKFDSLVTPALGARTGELFECLAHFERAGSRECFQALVAAQ